MDYLTNKQLGFSNSVSRDWNFGMPPADTSLGNPISFSPRKSGISNLIELNDYNFGLGHDLDFSVDQGNGAVFNNAVFDMSGPGAIPGTDAGSFTPTFADKFWGYKDPKSGMMYDGYAKTGLGAVQAGLGFYLGKGQLDQAKKSLRENQRQFNTNYAAQKATVNDQLRWQHRARAAGDPSYRDKLTQIV